MFRLELNTVCMKYEYDCCSYKQKRCVFILFLFTIPYDMRYFEFTVKTQHNVLIYSSATPPNANKTFKISVTKQSYNALILRILSLSAIEKIYISNYISMLITDFKEIFEGVQQTAEQQQFIYNNEEFRAARCSIPE